MSHCDAIFHAYISREGISGSIHQSTLNMSPMDYSDLLRCVTWCATWTGVQGFIQAEWESVFPNYVDLRVSRPDAW